MASPDLPTPILSARALRSPWPWAALAVGLVLSLAAWFQVRRMEEVRLGALEEAQANSVVEQVELRMKTLQHQLRSATGYLGRGSLPGRAEWHAYVDALNLPATYPGIQGMGFAEWIPAGELPSHLRRLRGEGFPDYTVSPGGGLAPDPAGCSSIIYLEPMDARNLRAFGKDMYAEPLRREAMIRARDTGEAALSAKIQLYQEGVTDIQAGTLLLAPVYRQGLALDTLAQRRQALRGWAFYPFRMADLIQATLARDAEMVDLELYDGLALDPTHLLWQTAPAQAARGRHRLRAFEVGGRAWTARIQPRAAFYTAAGQSAHGGILASGLGMSLLLFIAIWAFRGAEQRAMQLAEQRGEALLATESRFRAMFEKAPLGMAIVDSGSGQFLSVNARLGEILGYPPAELLKLDFQSLTHPEHLKADLASVKELASGARSEVHKEKRYLHRDGHEVWARLSMVRLPAAPGEALRHLSLVEDISEVRQASAAAAAASAFGHSLIDSIPLNIAVIDLQATILQVNRHWTSFALANGGSPEGAGLGVGANYLQVCGGGNFGPVREGIEAVLAGRRGAFIHDYECSAPDQLRWFRMLVTPIAGHPRFLVAHLDVTELKVAEQEARAGEARYRAIFEKNLAMKVVVDPADGRIVDANPAALRFYGWTREAFLQKRIQDINRDPAEAVQADMLLAATEQKNIFQFTHLTASGALRQVEVYSSPLQWGERLHLMSIIHDVTDTALARQALNLSHARYQGLFDLSPDGISVTRMRDGALVEVNEAWTSILGVSREEALGRSTADLGLYARPEDRQALFDHLARHGELSHFAVQLLRKDRSPLVAEMNGRIMDLGGESCLVVVLRDETARLAIQQALQDSEARFRTVAEDSPVPIFIHREDRFLYVNPAGAALLGAPGPEALLGTSVLARIHPEDHEVVGRRVESALETGRPNAIRSERFLTLAGEAVEVEVQGRHIIYGGFPAVMAFAQDIGSRRRNAEALMDIEIRARKAESLVLMAGGIAHDFNNLFQSIQSNLEVATLQARGDAGLTQSLAKTMATLRRAVGLSWKMLDFSGRGFLNPERLDLGDWLPGLMEGLRGGLPPTFHLDLACDPVPCIQGDRAKLEQVLRALLDNALEASGAQGGGVRVGLHVDFDEDHPGPGSLGLWPAPRPAGPATVCLEVADDGAGVPPDQLSRICDPFYTTRQAGRGLGLAAALGILRAHGAGLHVFNGERGLVLRLHFPPGGA